MRTSFHEERSVGLLLTFIGGAMDSYTYILYGAFASAQTGNIILAITQLFAHEWLSAGKKILATIVFFIGILLTKYFTDYFKQKKIYFWRLYILYFEAFVFFIISLDWTRQFPAMVTIAIAFSAALQWVAFDKINGRVYTNLFTTGNLKGVATNLYDYINTKNQESYEQFIHFSFVVLAFILGVTVAVTCYHFFQERSILLVSIIFLYLAIFETFLIQRFQQKTKKR